ncbi:hypothetical protein [Salinisphaera sp. G21_0]|uniref:hypothetical protein n=1 Tax=Salinisphaera sp. G21_0 TaxID=2821094 RepID=UPI001ADBFC5B|nr:hypothetical protein [Salinisphaera sp. G21_0]MBO9483510.1 hypothetical protein [Salinisphaera sp. G21_0]
MDRSSPIPFSVDQSTSFPDHRPSSENQSEVQALNRSLRREEPEKMLPDSQTRGDHDPSKSLASLRASRHSDPEVSVRQKPSTTHSAAEDSVKKVKDKTLFFEGKIAEQQTQTCQPRSHSSPHLSNQHCQPAQVSAESQSMQDLRHYSDRSCAPWEHELSTIGQNPTASASTQQPTEPSAKTPEKVKQELQDVIDDLYEYLVQLGAKPESDSV